MSDLPLTRIWTMRTCFIVLVFLILFFHLLPLETTPRNWVGPDFLLGFACAWSLRRPEYVPALALGGLFLLADLLLQRPPGLWALLALLGCENLKSRARSLRDTGFVSEWLTILVVVLGITLAYRVGLMITFVELPPLGLTLFETLMTIAFYPVVVAITHCVLGVRKIAPGDMEASGRNL